jgi:outer membrane protein assembly factor BamD
MPLRLFLCFSFCLNLLLLAGCATTPVTKSTEDYFKEGEALYRKKDYQEAIAQFKKVKESDSSAELTTKAELKIADAQFADKNYIEAAAAYEGFRKFHPNHAMAPYALYRLGLCYYNEIAGIDTDQSPVKNAVSAFESYLKQYPTAEHAAEVREKLAECITKQLQHEIYVGRFYYRSEKYQAAIKRLEECLVRYPKLPVMDEALLYLGKAYLESGDKVKGREVLDRLAKEYPASKYLEEAGKFMKKYGN